VRILGIDVGTSRTGVAISDPLGVTCGPLPVIREREDGKVILRVLDIADEYEVAEIVVGLPRPLAGGSNEQMDSVLAFAKRLAGTTAISVATWDERFTSKLAASGDKRRGDHDSVAACYMLQNYLESRSRD
jgi:putative holliday junction resolvase